MSDQPTTPLDRRDALRRAGLLGANLAWSVPAVQALGRAAAAEASGSGSTDPGGGGTSGGPTTTTVTRTATYVFTFDGGSTGPTNASGDPSVEIPSGVIFTPRVPADPGEGGTITPQAVRGSAVITQSSSQRRAERLGATAVGGPSGGTGASATFADPGNELVLGVDSGVPYEYVSLAVTVEVSELRTV